MPVTINHLSTYLSSLSIRSNLTALPLNLPLSLFLLVEARAWHATIFHKGSQGGKQKIKSVYCDDAASIPCMVHGTWYYINTNFRQAEKY